MCQCGGPSVKRMRAGVIERGRARADGGGASTEFGVRVSGIDPLFRVRDAVRVKREVRGIRQMGGTMGADGADASEGAVVPLYPQKRIQRIQHADII